MTEQPRAIKGGPYLLEPLDEAVAREILRWRYPEPYGFYDAPENAGEHLSEMLDGSHLVVRGHDGTLIGFFAFGDTAQVPGGHRYGAYRDEAIDFGLGMRPDLTGRGLGLEFVRAGLGYIVDRFQPPAVRLTVATFNQRAITVYQRAGFVPGTVFPGPTTHFMVMTRPADR